MYLLLSYIRYWFLQSEAHSIHAPFLFKYYTNVIRKKTRLDQDIERLRNELKANSTCIQLIDYGAGSITNNGNQRTIKSIANKVTSPPRFSLFLRETIKYFDYQNILELGTSLGLNTLYMARDNVEVNTFEGDPSLCSIAKQNFQRFLKQNIRVIEGNIDNTLPKFLEIGEDLDLVYIDANHRYAPTLSYFDHCLPKMSKKGMIILDDIHWSREMHKAWTEIKKRPEAILTIDIFEAGLVFLNKEIQSGDYILKF